MGTSDAGLFDDDVASDVRADYEELLEDQCDDQAAIDQVLARHLESLLDSDDESVVVLALAVSASKLGRLTTELRDRAVDFIDSGYGLARWEDDAALRLERVSVLAKAHVQLLGPQPARAVVRKPRQKVTPARMGDVYALEVAPGRFRAVRVTRVIDDRRFTLPEIQILDWVGDHLPRPKELVECPDLTNLPRRSTRLTIAGAGADPVDSGFVWVGSIPERAGDDASNTRSGTFWPALADRLRALDEAG